MDFRALHYFIAVYEELGLSSAAKRCFVAQPSISSAIQHLESELDCQLFVRHSKGVTPTPEGEKLYPYASKVVSDVQAIKLLFQEPLPKLSLSLALMPFLSGQRISLIIKELLACVPGLDLTVVDLTEKADARIVTVSDVLPEETFHKLWRDKYVLAMPKGHPFTRHQSIPLKLLDGAPFISRQPCDVNEAWKFATQKLGIILDVKATVKNEEYALDLVAAGLGISIVPSHSTSNRSNIVTRPMSDLDLERVVGLAYTMNQPLPPQLITAIKHVKEQLAVLMTRPAELTADITGNC